MLLAATCCSACPRPPKLTLKWPRNPGGRVRVEDASDRIGKEMEKGERMEERKGKMEEEWEDGCGRGVEREQHFRGGGAPSQMFVLEPAGVTLSLSSFCPKEVK